MPRIGITALLVLMSLCTALAEVNHWDAIKRLNKAYNDSRTVDAASAAAAEMREYMETLTASELITAARTYSKEVQERERYDLWTGAGMGLRFFWAYYPAASNGLQNIEPLIADMKDEGQPLFWRWMICNLLREWRSRLGVPQCVQTATAMRTIYLDHSQPVELRAKALDESSFILTSTLAANLRNDPNVASFVDDQGPNADYILAVSEGRVRPSLVAIKLDNEIRSEITAHISEQLKMFTDPAMPIDMQGKIISAWIRYSQVHVASDELQALLAKATKDFRKYDQELWPKLIQANVRPVQNPGVPGQLQQMLESVTVDHVRSQLLYFKKQLHNNSK